MLKFFKRTNDSSSICQRWTRINDVRIGVTAALVFGGCFSGITTKWSHFDGSGLWNDKYPHTTSSSSLLRILRSPLDA